ncbi:hypothetical protein ES288_A08G055100v1 [Gossypium darwinii]|uniref:Uncharacterized protein n=1 Tax=Gossypium darwinii TaxID=34276 RepID=A0A5D2FG01_GOSDA|nr:hypothetical protein ES288_A08G055100v1 [Gossypium darwinii]
MVLTSSLNRMIFLLNYTCQAICEESGEEIICQIPNVTHITCRHIFEDTGSLSILLPLANSCITLVKMMKPRTLRTCYLFPLSFIRPCYNKSKI